MTTDQKREILKCWIEDVDDSAIDALFDEYIDQDDFEDYVEDVFTTF